MTEQSQRLPVLPCPNCGQNLLEQGFHNTCTETSSLREDNYAETKYERLYLDHDDRDHEPVGHECNVEAYCSSCNHLLPWALYEIRGLSGVRLSQADAAIAKLLAKAAPERPDA